MNSHQSLTSLDALTILKPCAQGCIANIYCLAGSCCWNDYIAAAIGCGWGCSISSGGALNGCYCRTDLMPVANSHLTTCVKSACTIGDYSIDLSAASSLYNGYCNNLGYYLATTTTVGAMATPTAAPTFVVTETAGLPKVATQTLYVSAKSTSRRAAPSPRLIRLFLLVLQ
jgi:hypothetical protein